MCGGILPLNVLKDHIEPMALLASRIPRIVFEETYNLNLPAVTAAGKPREYVTWTVGAPSPETVRSWPALAIPAAQA